MYFYISNYTVLKVAVLDISTCTVPDAFEIEMLFSLSLWSAAINKITSYDAHPIPIDTDTSMCLSDRVDSLHHGRPDLTMTFFISPHVSIYHQSQKETHLK